MRKDPTRVVMAAIILTVGVAFATAAVAEAPQNPLEKCALFADIALTTRALVVEGVADEHGKRILAHIYTATPRFIDAILGSARSAVTAPHVYSRQMFSSCMQVHGR